MKRLARLTIVLIALFTMLGRPASIHAASHNAAGHDLLVVRSGTAYGSFTALPVPSDQASRGLPAGLFDRDGGVLYVANPQYGANPQSQSRSLVQAIDARSGRVLRSTTVAGYYSTMPGSLVPGALLGNGSGNAAPLRRTTTAAAGALSPRVLPAVPPIDTSQILSTLSHNGRWLALRDATPDAPDTSAVVIDTATMRAVATLHLHGAFGLDAIDDAGSMLYLVERRAHAGPQAYQVRGYDLRARRLDHAALTEPDDPSGIIRGVAYTRVWSPRGDRLYTLYVQPGKKSAFVHALSVAYHTVHCIMLPVETASGAGLTRDALAVSPDGSTLYAVNPALGRMVVVRDLPDGRAARVDLGRRAGAPQSMQRASALSEDGRTMYVATDRGVWVLDTAARRIRTTYAEGQRVTSLALSADGQRLYVLEPDQGQARVLDATTGRALTSVTVMTNAGGAEAIEQVLSE